MNILQSIFTDYYEHIIYELHPRPAVIENVNKMIHCGDSSHGGAMYGCPHCGNLKFVPFRCKSRFCPSCGNKYNQLRSFHMSCKLVSCVHRHCVFTIPAELRVYFLEDRTLLDCLFHSVRDVVLRLFSKMNKTENFTPGLICVLHTFGRDLKWNPHIHALISEGGAGIITPWRPVKHFDYNFLRNAFHKVLLEQLTSRIGPSFRKVKNEMYTRHEDNKTVTETIPALDFIQKLIVHIPEKHFKMLRYYGIYAKHHKQEMKLRKCISAEKQRFLRSIQDWRQSILLSFGYDPLCCSECGTSMLVLEVYHKKTALFEQYRKVMKYG